MFCSEGPRAHDSLVSESCIGHKFINRLSVGKLVHAQMISKTNGNCTKITFVPETSVKFRTIIIAKDGKTPIKPHGVPTMMGLYDDNINESRSSAITSSMCYKLYCTSCYDTPSPRRDGLYDGDSDVSR